MPNEKDDPMRLCACDFSQRAHALFSEVVGQGLYRAEKREEPVPITANPEPNEVGEPLPTVTLACIYAAQGQVHQAIEMLHIILKKDPDHLAAQTCLSELKAKQALSSPAPSALRADAYGEEEDRSSRCIAVPVTPTAIFVRWEIAQTTLTLLKGCCPQGTLTLFFLLVIPTWQGSQLYPGKRRLSWTVKGDYLFQQLPQKAIVRVVVGWDYRGSFLSIAHFPLLIRSGEGNPCSRIPSFLHGYTFKQLGKALFGVRRRIGDPLDFKTIEATCNVECRVALLFLFVSKEIKDRMRENQETQYWT
ncbi:hypothetical protein [Pajaroellobacter abortibovis]|uniref:Uncharacterized protein n=1 Tax=Pajaroellobacter abortibovis TaxID=1882918 RepID=A0A1L6MVZ6_9BACT|nr:hypothetical protein [Pajaroellobacter abortibovis]APR99696.1 hypothetical protein BCY86_02665 [Pajaroellobacter abortibovis]